MIGSKDSFTIGDVARLQDIPVKTVRGAISTGALRAKRFNERVIRVARSDLEDWLDHCQASAARLILKKADNK